MDDLFHSLDGGAVLLTATRRLSRVFRQDFTSWQRDLGRTVWNTPLILPLDAYVRHLWNGWLSETSEGLLLLTGDQEAAVWQQIIQDSPEGASLLQIEATARRAMEAWDLIQAYRLPLDARYQVGEDCEAFLEWARRFERLCTERRWIDGSRLSDFILARIRSGEIARPGAAWFAGFDKLSPLHREFLSEIGAAPFEAPLLRTVTRTKVCRTAEDEIRCAASWSRFVLEQEPAARIGIVVPNLSQLRSKAERIFRDVLQPGAATDSDSAFHISLGVAFDHYPLIHAALLLLEFAAGPMPLTRAGILLRSPYLRGAAQESTARAALDARLRRYSEWELTLDLLREQIYADCPRLRRSLDAFWSILCEIPGPQEHAEWSRVFSALLQTMGWPGDRPLNSHEHQLVSRWAELLTQFASLDTVSSRLSLSQAVARLRGLAAGTIFQFEDTGAPVQISDHIEIAGVRFDRLWVMGLHDEALPAPADPNPFLPISLQWEHALPNASADRQYETARIVFERLTSSASEVVLSFAEMEGDLRLSPSPFLTAAPQPETAPPSDWIARIRAAAEVETFVDETGPAHQDEAVQRGGAKLLHDMAACPFRAFATYRLGARKLECAEPGLTPGDKGNLLHAVMQLVWSELGSHANLCALPTDDLAALIQRHVSTVLDTWGSTTNVAVERVRLARLLIGWMNVERARPPFKVVKLEEKTTAEIGGLRLEIRGDRVDELPDGRQFIIDYKTGDVKSDGWTGERLDQPQLPLYCISTEAPVAGAAFARIQAADVILTGIAEPPFAGLKLYMGKDTVPLARQIEEWRRALTSLALQYRSGDARVDPKNGDKTCEFCAIVPLCRIRECNHD